MFDQVDEVISEATVKDVHRLVCFEPYEIKPFKFFLRSVTHLNFFDHLC